ncbi:PilZ domain-containing protein [Sphingomonas sp. GB1N7]|uniref:PilZ domain-containing protein n=1 Tax=Parasphingomonas caseinilytica TaxID=3096158 RepID=UPI002FCA17EB
MSETVAGGRAKRDSVFRTAGIMLDGGRRIECRVRNVSPTGVGVSHKGDLSTGMAIRIAIGKTPEVAATVAWATEDQAGIAFGAMPKSDDIKIASALPTVQAGWMAEIDDRYRK